jgi:hypothetical protein
MKSIGFIGAFATSRSRCLFVRQDATCLKTLKYRRDGGVAEMNTAGTAAVPG